MLRVASFSFAFRRICWAEGFEARSAIENREEEYHSDWVETSRGMKVRVGAVTSREGRSQDWVEMMISRRGRRGASEGRRKAYLSARCS